ncbi:MAG: protein-L-isoaspartate O-methyltransferase family protein, partial [Betaproteobacteria bacterium]
LEIEGELARMARDNLQRAGIHNTLVLQQDGAQPLTDPQLAGLFDVIVISGSVAEVPESLKRKLKPGGRLSAIVGSEPVMSATLITRVDEQAWRTEQKWETLAPRLRHFPTPSAFRF